MKEILCGYQIEKMVNFVFKKRIYRFNIIEQFYKIKNVLKIIKDVINACVLMKLLIINVQLLIGE